jgi:hypothetical protein
MGLDIYLYTKAEREQNDAHDAAWNAAYAELDAGRMTEDQWKDKVIEPAYTSYKDVPSARHPGHLFNRRYLRSSYNGGGFNRAVPDFVGEDHGLYWIFEPMGREWDGDEGTLTEADVAELRECKTRAEQVAAELRACDPLRVTATTTMVGSAEHMWSNWPTEDQVLAWYREEKAKHTDKPSPFSEGYSNAKGDVLGFTKGLEVLAATVGRDILGQPCAVLVYRASGEAFDSYVQSAEIVAEFCDEAISLIERDGSAYLSWSG